MDDLNAQIWAKLQEDAEFMSQPEAVVIASRPFIENLPELLNDLLDMPASLATFMEAKLRWVKYCLTSGYVRAAVEAYPESELGDTMREELLDVFEGMFEQLVEMLGELTGDGLVAMLEELGVTEDDVMLGSQVGLNEDATEQYQAGKLTVRALLEMQPMAILKNS